MKKKRKKKKRKRRRRRRRMATMSDAVFALDAVVAAAAASDSVVPRTLPIFWSGRRQDRTLLAELDHVRKPPGILFST